MKQIPLAIGPDPLPTFDSFLPGANAAAVAHLRALDMPARAGLPVGPGGQRQDPPAARAGAPAPGRRASAPAASMPATRRPGCCEPGWTLVVLDRCDALDAERQQAAFALFVEAGEAGVQWAAAGRVPPVDLPLRDDLRTRLGWGHVFALQPLRETETRAALRREADRRGIFLSDEVMDYLLTRFARDLGT